MTTYTIPDDLSFAGDWWLPSDAGRKVPGTLAWSKNEATLELHDSFVPLRSGPLFQSSQPQPVIHGSTTDNDEVSVLGASWSRGNISFGQRSPESFISSLVVVGAHVDSETSYVRLRARVPGLLVWLGESGVQQAISRRTTECPDEIMSYRIGRNAGGEVDLPCIRATLGWGSGWSTGGSVLTTVTIASYGYLEIAPHDPQTLDWYFEQLGKVTTLLTFMAGSPMKADEVTVKLDGRLPEINVLVGWNNAGYCPYRNPNEFFMPRQAMGAGFDAVLRTWFDSYDTVVMPSQLALSVLSSKGSWIHVEFLLLMQALEGFHRAVADGTYMPPEDYEKVRHALTMAIPASVGANHRDALKSRVKYGNELSLRKRLNDLAGRLDTNLRERIFGATDAVPQKWVATRNYYTHWDEASRNDALETKAMYYATVRLRHFLRVLYLDFVGIPQTAVANALDGTNAESQHLIQLNHPTAAFGHINVHSTDSTEPEDGRPSGETEPPPLPRGT